ncbi:MULTISPECIES: hypothetical protein [Sorangium]|uniref:hypothetical protein n=1 Tax=Sorangium TaxID=39643 RepID=UPI00101A8D6A|nr:MULTISPECIES: hypothetical protein [Sorangium]
MNTTTCSPTHPIVFVFDPSNSDVDVSAYDPGQVVSANASCVSIRTMADVDGDVTLTLGADLPPGITTGGIEVFRGTIDTPGGKVALVTSEDRVLLEMMDSRPRVPVRVLVDDEIHPARLWVELVDNAPSIP